MKAEDVPDYVIQQERDALAELSELDVHPSVRGGTVVLAGTAATEERREALGKAAGEAAPGFEVVNDVTVVPLAPPAAPEQLG